MCFCTYCGSQLFLDDGAVNINVTQNHNFTYRSINETKIRKAEIDRDIERRRIESSEHQQKNDNIIAAIAFMMMIIIGAGGIFLLNYLERDQKNEHAQQIARFEQLAEEIQSDIENEDYDAARIKANQIHYTVNWSDDAKERWDEYREDTLKLIDKLEYGDEYSTEGETTAGP